MTPTWQRPPCNGVVEAVGNTPLVRLTRLFADAPFDVYAKLEGCNPGGSIKDRPAVSIITDALRSGKLTPDSVVIESSSGNMAIGLAVACRYFNLRFICVVDTKTTSQNLRILRTYGANIVRVDRPDPATGEFLPARIARVQELLLQNPNSFWPNQYKNPLNSQVHRIRTFAEIATALDREVDYLFCATSTCGTLRGCVDHIAENQLDTRVVAVDAAGSKIFSTSQPSVRRIPGFGAPYRPPQCPTSGYEVVHVSDEDCITWCRRLVASVAILAGGSSGGVVAALHRLRHEIGPRKVCALILPDRGERYLDTVYDNDWVLKYYPHLEHLLV